MTVFWLVMVPLSIATGWIGSVAYVSVLSIYALFIGHLASWHATRVEVRQDAAEAREAKVGERVEKDVRAIRRRV